MVSSLEELLCELKGTPGQRIAIVGIGNTLNGDDAAGVIIARRLLVWNKRAWTFRLMTKMMDRRGRKLQPVRKHGLIRFPTRLLVIDAGPAPESFTSPLRCFAPQVVILVDAASMQAAPGSVGVFDWQQAEGMSASTHTMPPSMLAKFLSTEIGCRVVLVGIQPQQLEFDQPLSDTVNRAVIQVSAVLRSLL